METNNMTPAGGVTRMEKSRKLLILGAVLIILVGIVWYFGSMLQKEVAPEEQSAGLGSDIYGQANNPLGGKLPDTVAPVPNPIEGMYKNPF